MAVTTNNTADTYMGPYLGILNSVGVNLRASHSFGVRIRWNTTATNVENYATWYVDNGNGTFGFGGSYVYRVNGAGAGLVRFARSSDIGTEDSVNASGAYGSTTDWVHLCFVYDSGAALITAYVNGVSAGTVSSATTRTGSYTNCDYMAAGCGNHEAVDSFFFNRVLTAAEVFSLARLQRRPPQMSGCLVWIPMHNPASLTEEGRDYSGAGRNVTLQQSGTGNPAVSNGNPPIPWIKTRGGILVRAYSTPVNFDGGDCDSTTAAQGTLVSREAFTSGAATSTTSAVSTGLKVSKPWTSGAATSPSSATSTDLRVSKQLGAGASDTVSAGVGTLASREAAAGASDTISAAAGGLTVARSFTAGAATSPSAAAASLQVSKAFTAGASDTVSAAIGTLATRLLFTSGEATSTTAATGGLEQWLGFIGISDTVSAAVGGLHKDCVFAGASSTVSAAVTGLSVNKFFDGGVSDTITSATGVLAADGQFAIADCVTTSAAAGVLAAVKAFTPDCVEVTAASGDLQVFGAVTFSGDAASATSAQGTLWASREFNGACDSVSAAAGGLTVTEASAGAATTTSAAVGGLRVGKRFTVGASITRSRCVAMLTGGTTINPILPESELRRQSRRQTAVAGAFHRRTRM